MQKSTDRRHSSANQLTLLLRLTLLPCNNRTVVSLTIIYFFYHLPHFPLKHVGSSFFIFWTAQGWYGATAGHGRGLRNWTKAQEQYCERKRGKTNDCWNIICQSGAAADGLRNIPGYGFHLRRWDAGSRGLLFTFHSTSPPTPRWQAHTHTHALTLSAWCGVLKALWKLAGKNFISLSDNNSEWHLLSKVSVFLPTLVVSLSLLSLRLRTFTVVWLLPSCFLAWKLLTVVSNVLQRNSHGYTGKRIMSLLEFPFGPCSHSTVWQSRAGAATIFYSKWICLNKKLCTNRFWGPFILSPSAFYSADWSNKLA